MINKAFGCDPSVRESDSQRQDNRVWSFYKGKWRSKIPYKSSALSLTTGDDGHYQEWVHLLGTLVLYEGM